MSSSGLQTDHPVDALPDYVRGRAADPDAIERHLARCSDCRLEVEVLEALAEAGPEPISDIERERVFRALQARSPGAEPGQPGADPGPPSPQPGPPSPQPGQGMVPGHRGSGTESGRAGPPWLRVTWRAAAAVALVLGSVGVWQVIQRRPAAADWSPELALEAWSLDLAELEVEPGAVRVAFGLVDEIPWEDLGGVDPFEIRPPWEENR